MDWTTVLTALISAAAALAGLIVGYRIEEHRSVEARKARQEERDWQRNERKRQELIELQQALGDHIVRVDSLVADAQRENREGHAWQALRSRFNRDLYESQLRVVFLATRTADAGVYAAMQDLIGTCDVVIGAKSAEDTELALTPMSNSLGRADKLIFERLKVLDATPMHAP